MPQAAVILSEGRATKEARTSRRTPRMSEVTMQRQGVLTKLFVSSLTIVAALTTFPPFACADDDPAKALQTQFEAAKASLSAGDLVSAENHYLDTITLGLRQLAQISLSLGETDQSASYLDSALKLKPGDVETQLDAAGVWFRKGEVGKARALLKSVV